ncbi:MAG: hypothetical protein CMJ85_12730, partial [Planctomycetes bacterium]|nr:hypothetical protein [Planctomycetota bacterium]
MLGKTVLAFFLPLLLATSVSQSDKRGAFLSLIARDYSAAVEKLGTELAAVEKEPASAIENGADRLLFLLAGARLHAGNAAAAAADFARLEKDYPRSPYLTLARFGRARCLSRSRSFQDAAAIFRSEVQRLLSADRRVRLA